MIHWGAVKATIEDILRDREMWYGIARTAADTCGSLLTSKDSTIADQATIIANDSLIIIDKDRQYNELDKRTVPKVYLLWAALLATILTLIASQ